MNAAPKVVGRVAIMVAWQTSLQFAILAVPLYADCRPGLIPQKITSRSGAR